VLETLTGLGLATSAGLNAYIPLLAVGLLARYTHLITLPSSWHWLQNGWVVAILVVLLAIEVVADKVPVLDHVNDVVHTVVRPTAGGIAFGAASQSQTATVRDPGQFFTSHQWVPIVAGVLISLTVHGMKATARPVVNVTTAGVGAPVVSTIEDVFSTALSLVAILLPVLVLAFLVAIVACFVWVLRRRRRRKTARRAAGASPRDGSTLPLRFPRG
jgi:glucan phosphoethanolaminetransferase (alkaline phosphatase superfamily)